MTEQNRKPDVVSHPKHYTHGSIEVIDAIEDWKLGFHLGNVVKYIARAGHKDPSKTVEDLKKARWYLDREIARSEKTSTIRTVEPAQSSHDPDPDLESLRAMAAREAQSDGRPPERRCARSGCFHPEDEHTENAGCTRRIISPLLGGNVYCLCSKFIAAPPTCEGKS